MKTRYKYIRIGKKILAEHRLIIYKILGKTNLEVHHKNGNGLDNHKSNLVVTTSKIHNRLGNPNFKLIKSNAKSVNSIVVITKATWKKKCHTCKRWLPLSEFYLCDGCVRYNCKRCHNIGQRRKRKGGTYGK